ncbi:hypothetical protein AB1Y20_002867 [Prymnesium parvum]|uniref:Protein RFT1 homolog n=1 Tax=Prymnesium parvum TaxID=97485 RepID=A0AB34J9U1_PRYPA
METNSSSLPPALVDRVNVLESLGMTLFTIMAVQALGYGMKAARLTPEGFEIGLGFYLGRVAIPALLFRSMATLDLGAVDLTLIGAVVLGKLLVTTLAISLGRLAAPAGEAGGAFSLCGVMAMASTMSDDVGLGLPVMNALFPPGSAAANLVPLLFILSAVQALLFNPLSFVLLGIGAARAAAKREGDEGGAKQPSIGRIVLGVLRGLRRNPLILSVVLGLAYNVALYAVRGEFGRPLPWFLDRTTALLGRAFTPLVLFLAGAASVGSFAGLSSIHAASLPALLVGLQSLLLPFLIRLIIQAFGASRELTDFAFVYGILPCANSALVVARGYNLQPHLLSSLATFLALGKVLSFPLLFLAAVISSIAESADAIMQLREQISSLALTLSTAGLVAIVLTVPFVAAWRRCPLRRTLAYIAMQLAFCGMHLGGPAMQSSSSAGAKTFLFTAVSLARWGTSVQLALLALDDAYKARWRTARLRLAAAEGATAPSEDATDARADMGLRYHVALPLLCAGGLTFPWVMACELPPQPCLFLWLPFEGACGTSHRVVSTAAYAGQFALLCACLLFTLRSGEASGGEEESACSTALATAAEAEEPCKFSFKESVRTKHKLRLRFLFVLEAVRALLQAVLVISIDGTFTSTASAANCDTSPGFALALMILVVLVDGQGVVSFLLFGQQTDTGAIVRRAFRLLQGALLRTSCLRSACCLPRRSAVASDPGDDSALLLPARASADMLTELAASQGSVRLM